MIYTGRTLFGAKAPKGQELDDHYFGAIKPRVAAFMAELDRELWKLGVLAKTEHNEAAPAQHELAPIFTTTNIAADHNQLTMELMQKIARRYDMVCLLHEKPFAGVNGSGKHNNWSLSTDTGVNLLEPGETPYENAQFLLFLCAVIEATDKYQDLLRVSVASAGNDHRLGGHEAPPAIMSIFLGDELSAILDAIETDAAYGAKEKELLRVGVHVLPKFPKDTTDRNRTSPLAFTGNKFEFRSLGASASISDANVVMNTAVADVLREYADQLEQAPDFNQALHDLIRTAIRAHKRIIFNGNGYDPSWRVEAERRGLLNLPTTPDCVPCLLAEKNVQLFVKNRVFSEAELRARYEIYMENYCKVLTIEARTMLDIATRMIIPSVSKYAKSLADSAWAVRQVLPDAAPVEVPILADLTRLNREAMACVHALDDEMDALEGQSTTARANAFRDRVIPAMNALRTVCDTLETHTATEFWPMPSYGELLFGVR